MLPRSTVLLLLPLVVTGQGWDGEFARLCTDTKHFEPFPDGYVFKQCSYSPETGGKVEVVGCVEELQGKLIPIGKEVTAFDKSTGNIKMENVTSEVTDICEFIDGRWQWRRGSRHTKQYSAFLKKHKMCKKHGLDKRFLEKPTSRLYKQCSYDFDKNKFKVEIVACKSSKKGKGPLKVNEGRINYKTNEIETCTRERKNGKVNYEYRKMTPAEIEEKDTILALCSSPARFTAAFQHNGLYQICEKNRAGVFSLKIVGCISQESKGMQVYFNSTHTAYNGVIEVCEAQKDANGRVIGAQLKSTGKSEATTTPSGETEPETEEPSRGGFSKEETSELCGKAPLNRNFKPFDFVTVVKCVLDSNGEIKLQLVGCYVYGGGQTLAIGETFEGKRCENADNGRARMVIHDGAEDKLKPPFTTQQVYKLCGQHGIGKLFHFDHVAVWRCGRATDDMGNDYPYIELMGCFHYDFAFVKIGDVVGDQRCVAHNGIAEMMNDHALVTSTATTELLTTTTSITEEETTLPPASYEPETSTPAETTLSPEGEIRKKCLEKGIGVVFVEGNAAQKCVYGEPWGSGRIEIQTVGCYMKYERTPIMIGEAYERLTGITLRCVVKEDGGVELVPEELTTVEPETDGTTPSIPEVDPEETPSTVPTEPEATSTTAEPEVDQETSPSEPIEPEETPATEEPETTAAPVKPDTEAPSTPPQEETEEPETPAPETTSEPAIYNTTSSIDPDQDIKKKCDSKGIDIVFFELNVAKKCILAPRTTYGVIIETIGCRFALSETVVLLGETYEAWDAIFRCVADDDEGVHLVIEDPTPAPEEETTVEATTVTSTLSPAAKKERENRELCEKHGFYEVFFDGNVAKKCLETVTEIRTGIIVVIIGCRFAVTDTVVKLGETYDDWNVTFRCVATDDEGVELVIENPPTTTPSAPIEESNRTVDVTDYEQLAECNRRGYGTVFFDLNKAQKCVVAPETKFGAVIVTIGCRFAMTDIVVPFSETYQSWGVTFRCIESGDEGVHLEIIDVDETDETPLPADSSEAPSTTPLPDNEAECISREVDVVFFEENRAQKCVADAEGRVVLKTIGCRFALTETVVLLNETYDQWDATFRCVESGEGGVHLVVVEETKPDVTTIQPTVAPKKHCSFNGHAVPYKSRVIVGGRFKFECRKVASRTLAFRTLIGKLPRRNRTRIRRPRDVYVFQLHFLGCIESEEKGLVLAGKRGQGHVAHAVCDLSTMDASRIEVIN